MKAQKILPAGALPVFLRAEVIAKLKSSEALFRSKGVKQGIMDLLFYLNSNIGRARYRTEMNPLLIRAIVNMVRHDYIGELSLHNPGGLPGQQKLILPILERATTEMTFMGQRVIADDERREMGQSRSASDLIEYIDILRRQLEGQMPQIAILKSTPEAKPRRERPIPVEPSPLAKPAIVIDARPSEAIDHNVTTTLALTADATIAYIERIDLLLAAIKEHHSHPLLLQESSRLFEEVSREAEAALDNDNFDDAERLAHLAQRIRPENMRLQGLLRKIRIARVTIPD